MIVRNQRALLAAVALGLAALLLPAEASAQKTDIVTLRNGDRITGEVKKLVAGRLELSTDPAKTIFIEWDTIASITSDKFFDITLRDGRRVFGSLAPDPGGMLVSALASSELIPLDDVATFDRIRIGFWERLKGRIDVGLSFTKADNKTELTVAGNIYFRTERFKVELSGESLLRRQDNSEDVDRDDLTLNYRRFFTGRWIALAFASVQRNSELAIDRRLITGAGAGYHIVRNVEQDFLVSAGLSGASEQFGDERPNTESLEAQVGVGYDLYALGGRDFTANVTMLGFIGLTERGRFRSDLRVDFRREFIKDLYLTLRGWYTSDNRAENATAREDYGLTTGFGYSW